MREGLLYARAFLVAKGNFSGTSHFVIVFWEEDADWLLQ